MGLTSRPLAATYERRIICEPRIGGAYLPHFLSARPTCTLLLQEQQLTDQLKAITGQMAGLQQELESVKQQNLQLQCELDDMEAEKQSASGADISDTEMHREQVRVVRQLGLGL